MLWPFFDRRDRSALTPARRSRRRSAPHDRSGLGGSAAERLETRRMLAADITLVGGVLTVSFDDTSHDAVSLSITPTGYEATGANVTSGSGTISQLVVLDAGGAKISDLTLLQADQTLTGGLSIAANVTAARIQDSVTTDGGEIFVAASCVTTFTSVTLDSGSGDQIFSGPVELLGDLTIKAAGGGAVNFSGGVETFGTTESLAVDAGTAGSVTFSNVASTIAGNVFVTARNILITGDLVSNGGDITLVGDAGSTVAGAFHGVHVAGSGVEVKTLATNLVAGATGRIMILGRGGDAVAASAGSLPAYGVYLQGGASISAGGSGDVRVIGIGGVSSIDSYNSGVLISNSNAANGVSEIISAGGAIRVTGTAGGATGAGINYGVSVNSFARIAAGGSGTVSVTGTATETGGTGNSGVIVTNFNAASQAAPTAAITSAGGGVIIIGTGTADGAAVVLRNEGKVSSGGTAAVSIFADSLALDTNSGIGAGTITAGAAGDSTLQIVPLTAGTRIDLGGDDVRTGPTRTLGLSVAEIGRLNATDLFVGDETLAGPVIVSQPLAPTTVAALTILTDAGLTLAADVTTTAGQYYAADVTLDRDVRLASESRTLDLTEIGDYAITGVVRGVATSADGGIIYLADATDGLVILDVSDPAAPTLLGSVATPGLAEDVALSADGTTAYVTTGASGLQVVDVTDPQNPALRGAVATGNAANVATVPGGRYVAVTSTIGGLFLVDVLDPNAPTVVGSYRNTLAGSAGVAVSADGSRAYLCDFNDGLVVMDISDPAVPVPISTLGLGVAGVAADVAVSPFGNLVYVTDTRGQLWIVNVSGGAPVAVSTLAPVGAGGYLGLEVSADGETVFIATFENGGVGADGLVAVNVSDSTAPAVLDTLTLAAPAFTLALAPGGGVAYVADGSGGLRVVDCFTETPSNGRVTFTGTVNGPGGLTVATTDVVQFQASLGGTTPLASLAIANTKGSASLAGGPINTTGDQAYAGTVTLAADAALTATTGNVGFGNTVVGPWALAVTAAAIDVANGLGQSFNRLANLTLTGDTTLHGWIYTDGDQTYDGDVTLDGSVLMNTSFPAPATVRFTGLVDGDGAGFADGLEFELFNGSLVMESAVGSQNPLGSINVQSAAGVTLGGNVTTTGQQRYNAATLSLNGTYTTTDADFGLDVGPATATTLTGDATIATGTGNISLGNVAGDVADTRSLVLTTTGQSTLAGPGGSGRLASLTVSGGEARVGGMATSGSQSYGGDLRATNPSLLGNPVFSTAAGSLNVAGATILAANGTVSFEIQGGGLTFTGPIDNNDNPIPVSGLAINTTGDVLFGAAVGATRPPLDLSVTTPGNLTLSGNVTTWPGTGPWGVQTYAAKVLLAADATLEGLSVSMSAGLDGGGNNLVLDAADSTIAGGFANLASLTSPGNTTLSGNVATSGGQLYGGLTLGGNATLTAGGNVAFTGSVDGAHGLNVANAANVTFGGDVGQTTPLADLTVAAPTGTIDASSRTIAAGGLAFHSASQSVGEIETTGAVNGSAGTGNLTLNATGSLSAFGNLTASRNLTTGVGNTFFGVGSDSMGVRANNGSVTVGGNASIGGAEGGLVMNATDGNITFSGALDECGSTNALLGTSGDILFRGEVRNLDVLAIFGANNVTAEAAISGVGVFGQISGTGTTTLVDVATMMGQIYQTGTVHLTGSTYTTGGGDFLIDGSVAVGTGGSIGPVSVPGVLVPEELVTIETAGGDVTISGGTDGIYAFRPPLGPAAIIGSITSLAIDAGAGNVSLGSAAGFGSGGLLGLPLLNVTLAGDQVLLPATSNLIGGTLSVTEGTLTGSGMVGNLTFDPATTLLVAVGGLTPVTGYGQFTVDAFGTVDLGSAALTVASNIPVPVGTILTLVDNQGSAPVTGTFAGLPEGATVVGSGGTFKVSYVGGDGNDVTLEAVDGDIVVSVVDNRVVITLAPTGTTVTNLSTRYFPKGGRLVIVVAADSTITGGGTGVTVNDAAGTVTVNLAQLPGFTGFDVVGSAATDLITVGPGGINLAAVTRGAASQSVSIDTGAGSRDAITITRPVRMKGTGPFTVSTVATDPDAGIRLGTTVSTPRGPQSYSGPVALVGPTTLTGRGMAFAGTVDGARRLTMNSTGQVVFLEDVGVTTPLVGVTVQRATGVAVLGGFRLDGTGLGPQASGLVIGRNVNNVTFAALASSAIAPTVVPRSITGFGGSGILFQGGSTGSTIRDFALIGNGRGMTFQPGSYAGTAVQANAIAASTRIGICLTGARGLTLGGDEPQDGNEIGSGSVWRAYATGIYAEGNVTGTRVSGNTISLNAGNGIVMRNARGLFVGGAANTITGNGGWGLIASGVSTGSVVAGNTISGNTFGQVNVRRARGLRVVG